MKVLLVVLGAIIGAVAYAVFECVTDSMKERRERESKRVRDIIELQRTISEIKLDYKTRMHMAESDINSLRVYISKNCVKKDDVVDEAKE